MRLLLVASTAMLVACGGGEEDHQLAALRDRAMDRAEAGCASHRGVGRIMAERTTVTRHGDLLDLAVHCRCRDGWTFWTPARVE
jgi:hypothetical protein